MSWAACWVEMQGPSRQSATAMEPSGKMMASIAESEFIGVYQTTQIVSVSPN